MDGTDVVTGTAVVGGAVGEAGAPPQEVRRRNRPRHRRALGENMAYLHSWLAVIGY
jgi:hypothetical protein